MQTERNKFWGGQKDVWIHIFLLEQLKKIARVGDTSREKLSHRHTTWNVTRKSAQNDIASERRKRFRNCIMVSTPSLDDHHFEKEKLETVRDLSKVCSQFVLKCLYLDRMGGPDIRWSANKLPWAVTKWTRACGDCHLARLISYFHRHHCHLCNTAQHIVDRDYSKTPTLLDVLKILNKPRENLMYLRTSNVCSNKLDVQKANISASQVNWNWSYFFGCWWDTCPEPTELR